MAALHNSNNIIFANGGGDGKFPVSASFVVGGIDNSEVSAMTFQVVRPTQSVTGNSVTIKNEMGNSGNFALIPLTDNAGILSYNSGHIEVATPFAVSSQTTSTSGMYFYGNTAYNARYVYLNSNENEGQPFSINLPPKSETDIFYNANVIGSDTNEDTQFHFGIKETTTTASDWLDNDTIVFPENIDNGNQVHYSTVLRYRNNAVTPKTVYFACSTTDRGSLPSDAMYGIGEDSIKTRSYPL